jgi:hypothetical protein
MKTLAIFTLCLCAFVVQGADLARQNSTDAIRFAALSMIESGDNDITIGPDGEISRYQILPEIWRKYTKLPLSEAANPVAALNVARAIMSDRMSRFSNFQFSSFKPQQFYLLWHRPARLFAAHYPSLITAREAGRAQRFANLCEK